MSKTYAKFAVISEREMGEWLTGSASVRFDWTTKVCRAYNAAWEMKQATGCNPCLIASAKGEMKIYGHDRLSEFVHKYARDDNNLMVLDVALTGRGAD